MRVHARRSPSTGAAGPIPRVRRVATALALLAVPTGAALAPSPAVGALSMPNRPHAGATTATVTAAAPRGGAFCRKADAGKVVRTAKGTVLRCDTAPGDARYRWRTVK